MNGLDDSCRGDLALESQTLTQQVGDSLAAERALAMLSGFFGVVASLLYGLDSRDPVTFIVAASVLIAVAILAGWLPAWRASRMPPAAVLRH